MEPLALTYGNVLTVLSIIAVAMLIIVLYQLIFASISLRRIADRMEQLSRDVEAVILKPIGAIDFALDWVLSLVDSMRNDKKHSKKAKHHDVTN